MGCLVGLLESLIEKHSNQLFKIPLYSNHIRSLNLANAVSIVVYEGLKHIE